MSLGYHTITDEEMNLIGRVVTAFSAFEHELLRAIIAMNGAHDDPNAAPPEFANRFSRIVKGGFKARISSFCEEYRSAYGDDEFIRDFESDAADAVRIRDQFAHGLWDKAETGNLICRFFSREAMGRGFATVDMEFSVSDLESLFQLTLENAVRIMRRFGTV